VVDEADRLLRQAYQDWLPFVVAAASTQEGPLQQQSFPGHRVLKFVASATLTRDPAKIERLGLHCPRYLALEAADTRFVSLTSQL
jgi:ATP-dependent RNA helicase DDX51/DBP6